MIVDIRTPVRALRLWTDAHSPTDGIDGVAAAEHCCDAWARRPDPGVAQLAHVVRSYPRTRRVLPHPLGGWHAYPLLVIDARSPVRH